MTSLGDVEVYKTFGQLPLHLSHSETHKLTSTGKPLTPKQLTPATVCSVSVSMFCLNTWSSHENSFRTPLPWQNTPPEYKIFKDHTLRVFLDIFSEHKATQCLCTFIKHLGIFPVLSFVLSNCFQEHQRSRNRMKMVLYDYTILQYKFSTKAY